LRLTSAPVFEWVGVAESGTPGAVSGCPGTVSEPKAEAGKLCVYAKKQFNTESFPPEVELLYNGGTAFAFERVVPGIGQEIKESYGFGTWAVKR
jgi:hypothetical protein